MAARLAFRRVVVFAQTSMVAAALLGGAVPSRAGDIPAAERLSVSMDEARLIRLPDRVATIVIGNPLIADAALQPGGIVVLTGKSYGATNFIALDRKGNALFEKVIDVRGAIDTVVVHKGINRETYNCSPECQPVIAPGDFPAFYNQALVQSTTRTTQATASPSSR